MKKAFLFVLLPVMMLLFSCEKNSNQVTMVDQPFKLGEEFQFTVPSDYTHDTQIDTFANRTKGLKTTELFYKDLNSVNFAKASVRLEPGKTYKVKIFYVSQTTVTSDECMSFLADQNVILVGAQGLTLLQAEMPDKFPAGKNMVSFDQKDALWTSCNDHHFVPYVYRAREDNEWEFLMASFECAKWDGRVCLLCFSEV